MLLAFATGWVASGPPADMSSFAEAGRELLSGHIGKVYAGAWNQAGPIQLVISRVLLWNGDVVPARPVIGLLNAALMLLALTCCRRWHSRPIALAARHELVVGSLTLLWLSSSALWGGHPAEVIVPLCWLWSVRLHSAGKSLPAAAVLALAAAVAPWAVLGFPCLLAARDLRRGIGTAALASAMSLAVYVPFIVSGHFRLLRHRWVIDPSTLIHLIDPGAATANWAVRLLQAAVVAGGCAAVAWHARGRPAALAAAPLAAGLLRIATDPLRFDYYWITVAVTTIALIAAAPRCRSRLAVAALVTIAYGSWTTPILGWTLLGALTCLAALLLWLRKTPRAASGRGLPTLAYRLPPAPSRAAW